MQQQLKINGHTVTEPAAYFDKDGGVLFKIGEADAVKSEFDLAYNLYKDAAPTIAADLVYMDLPKSQKALDEILNVTGAIMKYYETVVS